MSLKLKTIFWLCSAGMVLITAVVLLPLLPGFGNRPVDPRLQMQNILFSLQHALDAYKFHCGTYPSDSQGLNALIVNPGVSNWRGPYYCADSIGGNLKDAWGTQIKYFVTAAGPHVLSAGPDKIFETADDISASNKAFHAIGASAPQHER